MKADNCTKDIGDFRKEAVSGFNRTEGRMRDNAMRVHQHKRKEKIRQQRQQREQEQNSSRQNG